MSKKPPLLQKGDTIGIMAPSSRVDRARLEQGVAMLEERGYNVYVHPQTWKKQGQSAGGVNDKVKALHDLFKNPKVKAIICARGGNRAGQMLPLLDYKLIKKNPKIIMGYSDVTALLNGIHKETGLITFHGPLVHHKAANTPPQKQQDQSFDLLSGEKMDIPMGRTKVLRAGKASGELVGGNLSLICSLMGTPWEPDFKGKILFLEDCDEELSRYDRMFQQLSNAGVFQQVKGVLLGAFTGATDTGFLPFGMTMEDIFREAVGGAKIPVVMNAPFGHGKNLYTLPVGGTANLKAASSGKVSFGLD